MRLALARHAALAATLALLAPTLGACGGGKPAEAPPPKGGSPLVAESDGEAMEGDLYAGFDPNHIQPGSEHGNASAPSNGAPSNGAPSNGGDGGSAAQDASCQGAAAAWEQKARPAIKACYREGKKSDPNLMGSARILVEVNLNGQAKPARLDGSSSLGESVAKCMVQAVQATAFTPPDDCKGRSLTIPVQFPTPR